MSFDFISEQEVLERGYEVKNGIIRRAEINLVGHFGGLVTIGFFVEMKDGLCCNWFSGYGVTITGGYVLKTIYELFDLMDDDPINVASIKNIPCRAVCDKQRVIGVGNWLKDKFVLEKELVEYSLKQVQIVIEREKLRGE